MLNAWFLSLSESAEAVDCNDDGGIVELCNCDGDDFDVELIFQ